MAYALCVYMVSRYYIGAHGRAIAVGLTHNDSCRLWLPVAIFFTVHAVSTWTRSCWHGLFVDKQYLCLTYLLCTFLSLLQKAGGEYVGLVISWWQNWSLTSAQSIIYCWDNDFYYALSYVHTIMANHISITRQLGRAISAAGTTILFLRRWWRWASLIQIWGRNRRLWLIAFISRLQHLSRFAKWLNYSYSLPTCILVPFGDGSWSG